MRWLIRLYPRAWQRRYGEEFALLLAQRPRTFATALDVVGGAIDAHRLSVRRGASMRTWRWRVAPVAVGLLILLLGGVLMQGPLARLVPWVAGGVGFGQFFAHPGLVDRPPPPPLLGVPEVLILASVAAVVLAVPARRLRDARRLAIVATLSAAAIATPTTDAISLLYAWAPLYLLFEVAFVLTHLARRERRATA
jgi:hypothetical protein